MSKYAICVIDDKLPSSQFSEFMDDTKMLNENNFKHLLSDQGSWEEAELLNLVKDLFEKDEYILSGFTSQSFFLNHVEENIFSPDVIIFDWDVGEGLNSNQKDILLEILESKYCLIAIYTGADNENAVTNVIKSNEFEAYENEGRLFLLKKEEEDSVVRLQTKIDESLDYFSFKLGQILRRNTLQAIDNILINISRLSFKQFVTAFGEYNRTSNESSLSKIDFIEIMIEKLQTELLNVEFSNFPLKEPRENVEDDELLRKLWHYRLYHKPQDNIVRKGDIIKRNEDDRLFLILTSDCHLNQFWKKNLGYLTLIPLYQIDNNIVRNKISEYTNRDTIRQFSISSIVNPQKLKNITILPAIQISDENQNDGQYVDYILTPKEIFSIEIPKPTGIDLNSQLKIEHLNDGYNGSGRIRIGEPFLSPLTQFILSEVAGYGTPDYSMELRDILKNSIRSINDDSI